MGYWTIKRNITDISTHNRFKNHIFISWKQEKTTMNSSYPCTHRYFQISNLHWRFSSCWMHRNSSRNKLKWLIISWIIQVTTKKEVPKFVWKKILNEDEYNFHKYSSSFFLTFDLFDSTQRKILMKWSIGTQIYLNPTLEMHRSKKKSWNEEWWWGSICLFY